MAIFLIVAPAYALDDVDTDDNDALDVANGGTNATDASGARTALGLVIGTDVQAVLSEGVFEDGDKTALDNLPKKDLNISELSDTTGTQTLTQSEMANGNTIHNASAAGAATLEIDTYYDTIDFCVVVIAAQNMSIAPPSGDNFIFNDVAASADEALVNESPTKGEMICSVAIADEIFAFSSHPDWVEDN